MEVSNRSVVLMKQALMKMRNVVIHREDVFHVAFVGEDVNHPGEYHRQERSTFGIAGFFRVDRTEHAELRFLAEVFLRFVLRGSAKICVFVPARHAQRNALIQLVLGGVGPRGSPSGPARAGGIATGRLRRQAIGRDLVHDVDRLCAGLDLGWAAGVGRQDDDR